MNGFILILMISALTGGILLASVLPSDVVWALIPITGSLSLLVFDVLSSRRNPFLLNAKKRYTSVLLFFLGVGYFISVLSAPSEVNIRKGKYYFSGTVKDYRLVSGGDRLLVSLDYLSNAFESNKGGTINKVSNINALILVRDATDANYGSLISGIAEFEPYDTPGNFRNDGYKAYLKNRHILLSGIVDEGLTVNNEHNSILSVFKKSADWLITKIELSSLSSELKDFLVAALIGDKSALSAEQKELFSDTGIAHIFAVSGFHISIIGAFIWFILSLIFPVARSKTAPLLAVIAIWFYILMTGSSPSTCRAGIMFTIMTCALAMQRKYNPAKALGWAVVIILCIYPSALFDIGFQLSVLCVGSIIFIVHPLQFINRRGHPGFYKIICAILIPLVTTFSCWLLVAFYFHKVTLIFLPANLLFIPLLPVFLFLSLVYVFLFSIGIDLYFLAHLLDTVFSSFYTFISILSGNSYLIKNFSPHLITVFIWTGGIAALGYALHTGKLKNYRYPAFILTAAIFSLIFISSPAVPDGFIIQRNSKSSTILSYENGTERLITIPDSVSNIISINGSRILTLNSENLTEDIKYYLFDADIIMLSGSCRKLPERISEFKKDGSKIVIHPSVHWRNESRILAEAQNNGLEVHSIRNHGPLHVFD